MTAGFAVGCTLLILFYLVYKANINSESLWYQSWGTFTNLNVFGSVLSEEAMVKRTSGGDGCDSPGDYLRSVNLKYVCMFNLHVCVFDTYLCTLNLLNSWDQMTWNITGDVGSGTVSSEKLCYRFAPFYTKYSLLYGLF